MLQRQTFQEHQVDEDIGPTLTPAYIYDIVKRRALYFAIPFVVVLTIGSLIALAWPAKYLAEGKILVASQEIPSDLVRPTVATLANERMQIIEQRIMTRDNLLAIAKKFGISTGWREQMSGTQIVDFIRNRAQIKPLEAKLPAGRKQAIAFTVGFEYEQPVIAMRVANEFVTMILNEDVRSRTNYAMETTKFLEKDVERLQAQLSAMDAQIAALKASRGIISQAEPTAFDDAKELATLKAQLLMASATYSDSHPNIRALKRKIEALEKSLASDPKAEGPQKSTAASNSDGGVSNNNSASTKPRQPLVDTLETQRASVEKELESATQKLAAARLGESLERGQHSERLEVIEQPTLPQKPVSPNRPKIFAFVFVFALMAGGGLALGAEMLNPAIRRRADLLSVVDSDLLVSIPYITTQAEVQKKKRTIVWSIVISGAVVLAGLVAILFVLPPLDVLFEKVIAILLR
jgi:uncharacterized protein involved in exopolysaccharide biosynthesis